MLNPEQNDTNKMNMTRESVVKISRARHQECEEYCIWLQRRLKLLSKLNWVTVLVPSLLGIIAGSAYFAAADYSQQIAIAALVAALLSGTHKGLNCDAFQLDCRRLLKGYRELAASYRSLSDVAREDDNARLLELETKLELLNGSDEICKIPRSAT